ncbi:MAG: ABC transporter ATP-binding protein [Actinomycetes bacterium]
MTLIIEKLHVQHGAITAIDDLSFTINQGELVTIIGSNGAGKTTLLRALSGLLPVAGGRAEWKDKSILGERPEDLVRRGIVHVSEGKAVIPELSVAENLELGGIWRKDKRDIAAATAEVLELFPRLGERMKQGADTLSGGERQMLAIGRAMIARPELLLLDEPSLGLAPLIIDQIFAAVDALRHRLGLTVVLVEQNAMSALSIADRGIIINLGQLVISGTSADLLNDPALRSAYLGY